MMKKRMFAILVAVMLVLTMLPTSAFAVSASAWFNGPGTVRAGDTITLGFCVGGTNIFGASGSLSYDSSQLTLLGTAQSIGSPWVVELNGPNFVAYDNNLVAPINGGTTLIRATFQVNNVAPGTTITVSCNNVRASDGTADAYMGTVTYSATVAPPLSSDNALKSLTVSNAAISPGFAPGVTSYSAQVPYEISQLNVSAVANDEKATVSINSPTLTPNATTNVTVTVTAENGATNTYTIAVKRAQDPNYVPSNNSKLSSITVEEFRLSPAFSKDRTEYVIWLPYEVDSVSISGAAEDGLARVRVEGGTNLIPGADNPVKVICIAEDGTQTVYTVLAKRGPVHEGMDAPVVPETTAPETEPPTEETTQVTEPAATEKKDDATKNGGSLGLMLLLIVLAFLIGLICGFVVCRMLGKKKKK